MRQWKKAAARQLCIVVDRLKPLLIKLLPRSVLRYLKNHLLYRVVVPEGRERLPYEPGAYPQGINLFGHLRAEMGLGQGARLTAYALRESGLPYCLINFETGNSARHADNELSAEFTDTPRYSINLIHINAGQMDLLHLMRPKEDWDRRYNIAVWLWELEDFPDEWCKYFSLVDEIWAPSRFTAQSIARKSPVPVRVIPYGICAEADDTAGRAAFHLPENLFLFLCMYDVNSMMARKNPLGAIHAFKKAFGHQENGVGLVIKVNNSTERELSLLRRELEGYPNIYFITNILPRAQVYSLIKACDVFVSLHRSEGFGLVLAEAMLLARPVIGTNWSSVTDFMTKENSCPVGYELIRLQQDYYMFKENQRWAEPDIGEAAAYMRRLYADKSYYETIAQNGQRDIRRNFSPEKAGEAIYGRLCELGLFNESPVL
ncbi:MAG: glycosyltransferase family 4 protein [Provencibacterium sp.]|nr:glycosyltransferase family 4 protein [Provencibacterium sp.]